MVDQPIRKIFVEQERFNTALKALEEKITKIQENQKLIMQDQQKFLMPSAHLKMR